MLARARYELHIAKHSLIVLLLAVTACASQSETGMELLRG